MLHSSSLPSTACALPPDLRGTAELVALSAAGDVRGTDSFLTASGIDINSPNQLGDTALHYACAHSHSEVVSLLLSHGADVRKQNNDGETPLHYAALAGDEAIARMLVAQGAAVCTATTTGLFTPLHNAVWRRNFAVASLLLSAGADPNAQTVDGHTSLHLACITAPSTRIPTSLEMLKLLLRYGSDPKICDHHGKLPADYSSAISSLLTP